MRKPAILCLVLFGLGLTAGDSGAQMATTVRLRQRLMNGQTARASIVLPSDWGLDRQPEGNSANLRRFLTWAQAEVAIVEGETAIKSAVLLGRDLTRMGCNVQLDVDRANARQGITRAVLTATCGPKASAVAMFRAFPGRKKVILVGFAVIRGLPSQANRLMKALGKARLR